MRDKIKVSIIIPTFNAAPQLPECIDHILNQQCDQNFEIIISDDGSTDKTPEIMKQYVEDINGRIVYLRHENVRRAENRNVGARAACGDIFIFLDSGMITLPNFLQAHIDNCQNNGPNAVTLGPTPVHQSCLKHPVGRFLAKKWERRFITLAKKPTDVSLMISNNFSIWRQFYWQLEGFDRTFQLYGGEDTDFFVRARKQNASFFYREDAKALQIVDTSFNTLYRKKRELVSNSKILADRYVEFRQPRNHKIDEYKSVGLKEKLWRISRKTIIRDKVLYLLIPILEIFLTDRYLFLIYNSLLLSIPGND